MKKLTCILSLLLSLTMLLGVCLTATSCESTKGPQGPQGEKGETGEKGDPGINGADGKDGKDGIHGKDTESIMEYMHISFDDTYKCFQNLQNNNYTSIFQEKFLGWMKRMHDQWGAVFSIYVFNEEFTAYANSEKAAQYASEFYAAKDWLKIGLHSPANNQNLNFGTDKGTDYSTYEAGQLQWNIFVNSVLKVTGSYLSIDRMPRLHNCAGTEAALQGMRDANYGALGFLAVDDTRNVYYLESFGSGNSRWLFNHDHVTDYKNGLTFIATDIRAEYLKNSGYSSYTTMAEELEYRYSDASMANRGRAMILFSHENRIQNNSDGVQTAMEQACEYAKAHGIPFDFPQNRSYTPTQKDIHP